MRPEPRGAWRIAFEGRSLAAVPGESLMATLLAGGETTFGFAKDGAPRGPFCGMGVCHDCMVMVDGQAGQRACLAKVRDGMRVARHPARLDLHASALADLAVPPAAIPAREVDVLVVGAGPAGLSAAESAAAAGASVLVVDERPAAGGQYFKQPGTAGAERARDRQGAAGAALIGRVRALGVDLLAGTLVWGAERGPDGRLSVACLTGGAALTIRPHRLIVATGASERAPMLPGWTLPGVMTTGALQTLVRSDGVVPGTRILLAGNGPLNIQVAAEILSHGAAVVALVEAAPAPWTRMGAGAALMRHAPGLAAVGLRQIARLHGAGVPVLWGTRVKRLEGQGRVERVILERLGDGGEPPMVVADIVAIGEGFAPANELPRLLGCRHVPDGRGDGLAVCRDAFGATSQPDVFVAGEAGRFGGAQVARLQGRLAGRQAARSLGHAVAGDDKPLRAELDRHEAFQRALWAVFAAPSPGLSRATPATVLCRCEALTRGTLDDAITRHQITDLATLKRLTRAGMGRCQGRACAPSLAALLGITLRDEAAGFAPQMPLRPVPLAALAVEKPEWGGHRRSMLPAWRGSAGADETLPLRSADVVVIGAGIAGLSVALFLARAGHDVLVVDRAHPNALASGGNAGSLHAQLLSFDHGARAEAGGGPAALTLPLQRDSIALWMELEQELGLDFEIRRTGGLMVADTEADLVFLAAKTAVERRHGVDCDIIRAGDLRALEPALGEGFVGAAYCPGEGKINPLVATEGILHAALAAGARLARQTEVRAIRRDEAGGFAIDTARGPIRARRLVNAAGAFASAVGRMLGVTVPVFGAPLQMVVTEAVAPLISCLVAHAGRHLTLKQAANGNVLIGGGWTAGLDPVHGHPRPLIGSLEGNVWVAQHVVPALRKLHVIRSWAAMNINIDGAPILGEDPRVPGLFHAVTSNGYTLGPLVGRITAQLIGGGAADRDVAGFSIARFGGGA